MLLAAQVAVALPGPTGTLVCKHTLDRMRSADAGRRLPGDGTAGGAGRCRRPVYSTDCTRGDAGAAKLHHGQCEGFSSGGNGGLND